MDSSKLRKFGKTIYNHIIQQTSPNKDFYLCIDSFTFETLAWEAGLKEQELQFIYAGETLYRNSTPEEALVNAALQVKIAYDIETDENLMNSYRPRLQKAMPKKFDDYESTGSYLKEYKHEIWGKVIKLFSNAQNRRLYVDADKGNNSYVRFPVSQRIIKGSDIIKYADIFIRAHLKPNQLISFNEFQKIIFPHTYPNHIVRKMIFSFYCMWDGRTYREIRLSGVRRHNSTHNQPKLEKKQIFIQFDSDNLEKTELSIGNNQIDLMKRNPLLEDYLYRFDENKYLIRKGIVFSQDYDYKDWIPYDGNINSFEEYLLISENRITEYFKRYEQYIRTYKIGAYFFIIFKAAAQDILKDLKLLESKKNCFELVGGLRESRNTFYSFALPTVKLADGLLDSEGNKYIEIYVDSVSHSLENNQFNLRLEDLADGEQHVIKLWDSSFFKFKVVMPIGEIVEPKGWNLIHDEKCVEADCAEDSVLIGTKQIKQIDWIQHYKQIFERNMHLRDFEQNLMNKEFRFYKSIDSTRGKICLARFF